MTLEDARDMQANNLDNQPGFQQLISPGMEEFFEKITHNFNSHLASPHEPARDSNPCVIVKVLLHRTGKQYVSPLKWT
jgi:hypothetical protein